jgi:hypothetical protein
MKSALIRIVLIGFALTLVACGSTSKMKSTPASGSGEQKAAIAADFSRFSKVIVRDFENAVESKTKDAAKREVQMSQATAAGKRFADLIAEGLKGNPAFSSVAREGEPDAQTLVIGGQVTKYKKGNRALRLVVGFGAGSANFDARVSFVDGASGSELSHVVVDKNSWFLGGIMAAAQTVDDFVEGAATKVAEETIRAKSGQP